MKIEGKLLPPKGKKNPFWGVEIPLLGIHTQGRTRDDALLMTKDAIESLVNKKEFAAEVCLESDDIFSVTSSDGAAFLAFVLSRLRSTYGFTARQVSGRLQSSSPNAYARYEQGRAMPKLSTFEDLLKAICPGLNLVLRVD